MEYDAFTQGIEPGGLRNRSDIGILLCYLLDYIGKPFRMDDLTEIFQENGFANYFETMSSLSELIKNKNIEYTDDRKQYIVITDNGRLIASQLNSMLSLSIRQKAAAAAAGLIRIRKNEKENPVRIKRAEGGGYSVELKICDGIRELMALTLFVPDISEANRIKRSFYKNPQRLYSVVLAGATGDNDMMRAALEELK